MSKQTTRISFEEFSRDVAGFLDRVTQFGDRLEVRWRDGRVALIHQDPTRADADADGGEVELDAQIVRDRIARSLAELPPITPELLAQRRAALAEADALRAQIAREHPGVTFDAVADIQAGREERDRQLDRL